MSRGEPTCYIADMAEWQTQLTQNHPLNGLGVQVPLSAPIFIYA